MFFTQGVSGKLRLPESYNLALYDGWKENVPFLAIFCNAGNILTTDGRLHVEEVMLQQEAQIPASSLVWWPLLFQNRRPGSEASSFTPPTTRLRN